jgi:2-haloacid dehalogenase
VHRDGFAASNQRLHGDFAAIITAEDVGAYQPANNHFRALDSTLAGLGVDRTELLHVAQSLFHDHVAAKREGLPSVWINRRHDRPGWGATPQPTEQWTYNLAFNSMADYLTARFYSGAPVPVTGRGVPAAHRAARPRAVIPTGNPL